ncbi:MAG: GGDEF domain-containing protein [Acidobacteriota bacterium]|nr:GGDEF domain-containing protein [Acidobacteriota bacterium]
MPTKSLLNAVVEQIEQLQERRLSRLQFPAALEDRFERDVGPKRALRFWFEGLLAILLFNFFLLANHLLLHTVPWHAVLLRTALVTPLSLVVNQLMRMKPKRYLRESSVAVASCLICFIHLWLEQGPDAMGAFYAQIGVLICVLFVNVVMRLYFAYALVSTLVIAAGDAWAMVLDKSRTPEEQIFGGTLVACAIGMTLVANYSLCREERLAYLLQLRATLRSEALTANNQELLRVSNLDALTGLANRRALMQARQRLWKQARSAKTPLSAIVLDIDHFKRLNDLRGHLYGDEVLRRLGQLIQQGLRGKDDFAARYGGEEFVVLMPDTPTAGAVLAAERIRRLVEVAGSPAAHVEDGLEQVWTTISCGVATCWPSSTVQPDDLLAAADKALYRAKQLGRNQVCVSEWSQGSAGTAATSRRERSSGSHRAASANS